MLKEQVTFLSSQVTELNRTVRFQERLIDRLLTYLPVSTKEYIPTALGSEDYYNYEVITL